MGPANEALLEGGLSPFADLEVPLAHLSDNVKEPCYPVEDFSLMEGLPNISTDLQSQRPAGISIDDRHHSADALAVGVAFHFEP